MLQQIYVNGFRSLHEFDMAIEPGLNVLVGPNGAGKTNIISFLEFLSNFVSANTPHAMAQAGGTAAVFSVETTSEEDSVFNFSASGLADLDEYSSAKRRTYVAFKYSAEIRFIKSESALAITHEVLEFSPSWQSAAKRPTQRQSLAYSIEVNRSVAQLDEGPSARVRGPRTEFIERLRRRTLAYTSKVNLSGFVADALADAPPYTSVLNSEYIMHKTIFSAVRNSIYLGFSYNIRPERAKRPDDLSTGFGVLKDGSGLTASLHGLSTLKQGRLYPNTRFRFRRPRYRIDQAKSFSEIEHLTSLINPDVVGIEVRPNMELGKYTGHLKIRSGAPIFQDSSPIFVPFANASDGTIKWIALVTALITDAEIAAIEEPENFLHPTMQSEIVALCRERLGRGRQETTMFLSTHSETLLNSCRPQELVVVRSDDGRTVANRPENADEISREIRETGFGLGYFYVANAVG